MVNATDDQIKSIGKVLTDSSRPMKERFRAMFTLRGIGGDLAIESLAAAFTDSSALLKHELAYCMGQMKDETANPILTEVLEDPNQQPIVRHEAGEALAAIGTPENLEILRKYQNHPIPEIAETCQIALDRIKWTQSQKNDDKLSENPYNTIDPAPASEETDVHKLKEILLDSNASLFDRYRAMFTLRNMQTEEAVDALIPALVTKSPLFKHELVFILGQSHDRRVVAHLKEALEDQTESEMVRHECVEALGAIGTDECTDLIKHYLHDSNRVVKESCEVALDGYRYELLYGKA